jgi:hypothetical protein
MTQAEMDAHFFVSKGCEYYAVARFAMHTQRTWVCGNLFHHAIETLLKGGLRNKGFTLTQLKAMGHDLKPLWREFKKTFPDNLAQHDKTISLLNKFEDIRYPTAAVKSMAISSQWAGSPPTAKYYGGKTSKQFTLIVSDIDNLVGDIIKASSWNPGVIMGRNRFALTAIRRQNKRARFLTKVL